MEWDLPYQYQPAIGVLLATMAINLFLCSEKYLSRALRSPEAYAGRIVDMFERRYNRTELTPTMLKVDGIANTSLLLLIGLVMGFFLHYLFSLVPYGWLLEAFTITTLIQFRQYFDQTRTMADALDRSLEEARATIALIAGHDAYELDEPGVARASIENTAKTLTSGFVGPIVYYLLFGLPGIFIFKIVVTANYMIDVRSKLGADFGWASAKLTSILLWPINKITAVLINLTALTLGRGNFILSTKCAFQQTRGYFHSCGAWPLGAMAGALALKLGGPICIDKDQLHGDWIGVGSSYADSDDIRISHKIFLTSCAIIIAFLTTLLLLKIGTPSDMWELTFSPQIKEIPSPIT